MITKVLVGIGCLLLYLLMLWTTYRKGQSEERYRQRYCSDCGDDREQDGLCHDCRRKLWGEQR